MTASLEIAAKAVDGWTARPLILGVCGGQGSGKSTLATGLKARLEARGERVAQLSIDDLYLGRAARADLAARVHPLFATRGVPGTHDMDLGLRLFDDMLAGRTVRLPRFDKANDEPFPVSEWPEVTAPGVIIFEGWCVGARPQRHAALMRPVNALESDEDPEARWRSYVNDALKGPYGRLFSRLNRLILLAAPDFAAVRVWRGQQENGLRNRLQREGRTGRHVMSPAELDRFVAHYQRLTGHILREMPGRADLVISLDERRNPRSIKRR